MAATGESELDRVLIWTIVSNRNLPGKCFRTYNFTPRHQNVIRKVPDCFDILIPEGYQRLLYEDGDDGTMDKGDLILPTKKPRTNSNDPLYQCLKANYCYLPYPTDYQQRDDDVCRQRYMKVKVKQGALIRVINEYQNLDGEHFKGTSFLKCLTSWTNIDQTDHFRMDVSENRLDTVIYLRSGGHGYDLVEVKRRCRVSILTSSSLGENSYQPRRSASYKFDGKKKYSRILDDLLAYHVTDRNLYWENFAHNDYGGWADLDENTADLDDTFPPANYRDPRYCHVANSCDNIASADLVEPCSNRLEPRLLDIRGMSVLSGGSYVETRSLILVTNFQFPKDSFLDQHKVPSVPASKLLFTDKRLWYHSEIFLPSNAEAGALLDLIMAKLIGDNPVMVFPYKPPQREIRQDYYDPLVVSLVEGLRRSLKMVQLPHGELATNLYSELYSSDKSSWDGIRSVNKDSDYQILKTLHEYLHGISRGHRYTSNFSTIDDENDGRLGTESEGYKTILKVAGSLYRNAFEVNRELYDRGQEVVTIADKWSRDDETERLGEGVRSNNDYFYMMGSVL